MWRESEEYITYKMNADSSWNLYVPIWWLSHTNTYGNQYNWKVSVDGWTSTTYSWTWSAWWKITLSWYSSWVHTITIEPVSEDYWWALAFWWANTQIGNYLKEIIHDTYKWYAVSATETWNYFKALQYSSCTWLTSLCNEILPNTVTTIWDYYMYQQCNSCTWLIASPQEALPSSVTSIWSRFRMQQFYWCTSLNEIKWWKDLSIGWSNYRANQYNWCTANKTVKVLSNVWYAAYNIYALDNTYVTSVSVPSAYLNNFKNATTRPRVDITDSKFVWY